MSALHLLFPLYHLVSVLGSLDGRSPGLGRGTCSGIETLIHLCMMNYIRPVGLLTPQTRTGIFFSSPSHHSVITFSSGLGRQIGKSPGRLLGLFIGLLQDSYNNHSPLAQLPTAQDSGLHQHSGLLQLVYCRICAPIDRLDSGAGWVVT